MELYNRCKNMFYDYTIDLLNCNEIITEKLAEEYFTKNIIPKSKNDTGKRSAATYGIEDQIKDVASYIANSLEGLPKHIPIRFTKIEKEYIKAMLKDCEATLFTDEELCEKLKKRLADTEDIDIGSTDVRIKNASVRDEYTESDKKRLSKNIELIKKAVFDRRQISYTNHTRNGIKDGTATPYKIIYSLRTRKLQLIAMTDRLILMNIDSLDNISILDETSEHSFNDANEGIKERKKSMTIVVEKSKNAHERAFMMFSHLKKNSNLQ